MDRIHIQPAHKVYCDLVIFLNVDSYSFELIHFPTQTWASLRRPRSRAYFLPGDIMVLVLLGSFDLHYRLASNTGKTARFSLLNNKVLCDVFNNCDTSFLAAPSRDWNMVFYVIYISGSNCVCTQMNINKIYINPLYKEEALNKHALWRLEIR